jgi:hypothetical protein
MNDKAIKEIITKLQIIKELSAEKSAQQICDALIIFFRTCNKSSIGFKVGSDAQPDTVEKGV